MTKSQIFLYFCLSFIFGIALSSFFLVPWPALLAILVFGLILFSLWLLAVKLALLGFCLILFSVGIWWHQEVDFRIKNSELREYNDREQVITLIGRVIKEPDIRETTIGLTIKAETIESRDKGSRWIEEKVLVTTSRYPEYRYGDKLKIKGELKTPPVFEDFNYQDYLAKQGVHSVIYWPEIELQNQGNYRGQSSVISLILGFKQKLREVAEQNLSPPQSALFAAIILGDKRRMSEELKEELNITGLRHITAISGMHITILGLILFKIFLGLGLWRSQALYLSLISLILFIFMVGAPPSAVRAGIMGGLLIIAQSLGRLSQASRSIIFAATAILIFNPLLLKSDVGFQLSFLATLGIVFLVPTFQDWLKKVPEKIFGFLELQSIIAMTFAAQIFTLPILIFNFGRFSLVSPLTNTLIVPLLPFLMGLGLIFLLGGWLWPFFGWLLSWPCWFLLTSITKVTDFFSKSPWSASYLEIPWPWLLVSYLILAYFAWYLNKRQRYKFLGY